MEDPRIEMRRKRLLRERQMENVAMETQFAIHNGHVEGLQSRLNRSTCMVLIESAAMMPSPIFHRGIGMVGTLKPRAS